MITKTPITLTMTLREVFDNHYARERLIDGAAGTIKKWREAIRYYDDALGRRSTVADLTHETLEAAVESINLSATTVGRVRQKIACLWRYVDEVAHQLCRPAPPKPGRPTKTVIIRDTAPDAHGKPAETLWFLFHERFKKGRTIALFASAGFKFTLRRLDCVLGRQATVHDLNLETIARFNASMERDKMSAKTSADHICRIRRLWQFADMLGIVEAPPEEFKSRRVGRPRQIAATIPPEEELQPARPPEELTPADLLDDLYAAYAWRRLRGSSYSTKRKYLAAATTLGMSLGRPALIGDLTGDNINDAVWYVINRGREIVTANGMRAKLVALWNFSFKRGILKTAADVEKMAEPRRAPIAWTQDELDILFTTCQGLQGMVGQIPACHFWPSLLCVLYDSAERISAVLSARWRHYDPATRHLKILAEFRKGRVDERIYTLHPDTAAYLELIREPARELIFPWPMVPGHIHFAYARILRRAGLPSDRWHQFHALRRSVASHGMAHGMDPASILGHADGGALARKHYIDVRISSPAQPCDVLRRPDGSSPARLLTVEGVAS